MGNKKTKKPEEAILEWLTPELLLQFAKEDDDILFIGDTVQLITDSKWDKVYTIYSYKTYADWRINFTLWNWDNYDMYEPWQIKKYIPIPPIWFTAPTNEAKSDI